MSALKILQEQRNFQSQQPGKAAESNALNPYFQIHFQHIHENIAEVKDELERLEHYSVDLNAKLDRLTALLVEQLPQQWDVDTADDGGRYRHPKTLG